MGDLLQSGLDWLEGQRRQHMTRTVVYGRGDLTVTVPATVGSTRFENDDGYGLVVEQEMRDYIVAASDLVLDGQAVTPEIGDEVREERGSQTFVYEVMTLGPEPHYRACDPAGNTYRIHTKHVRTEP